MGRYMFSHAIIRQTLNTALATAPRAQLHARVGAALEEAGGSGPTAAELALHFTRAVPLVGADKAITYATRAGHNALADLAFEDAATLSSLMHSAVPGGNINLRLCEYTQARRPRVARVAKTSRRLDLLFQAQGRLTVAARDAALSRFSHRLLGRANTTAFDWAAPD